MFVDFYNFLKIFELLNFLEIVLIFLNSTISQLVWCSTTLSLRRLKIIQTMSKKIARHSHKRRCCFNDAHSIASSVVESTIFMFN